MMQVNPNPLPGCHDKSTVHIHVQHPTVPSQLQQLIQSSILFSNEYIPFFTPEEIYGLSRVNKAFKELIMDQNHADQCLSTPSSWLNICRVRHLLLNTQAAPMNWEKIKIIINLENTLGIKLRPFHYIHHFSFDDIMWKWLRNPIMLKKTKSCELSKLNNQLAQLSSYTALRSLSIAQCEDIAWITHHMQLNQLNFLDLCQPKTLNMEPLTQLTNLKSLSLSLENSTSNADHLTDAWTTVARISSLATLDLSFYCPKITDAGLHVLQGLTVLRSLKIKGCANILAAHLQPFAGTLQTLTYEEIERPSVFLQGEDAHALGSFTSLQHIRLDYEEHTNIAWVGLHKLSVLQTLELKNTGFTISDLAHLHGLTALRELTITPPYDLHENWLETKNELSHLFLQLPALQTAKAIIRDAFFIKDLIYTRK